ncbi:hypothetical protein L1987_04436 [Smallanthus sonchifolius]|uniref:Uncharacterized protein n=1 Tax=Smallanthus sonchifolius TaxID=185202 RepID=A0ACB9KDE1_9ASTR|nr:hypothetical protein L1987_04436 [Smallanthus sonchifolius]
MVAGNSKSDISFAGTFASSAFAACFAEICTIPLDTAKVRLQLQKKGIAGDGMGLPKYRGMLGTVATIAREEGLASLWKGIIKNLYVGDNFIGDVPLTTKILAGLTTGALAIAVANPTDLVKVRLQAEGKLPAGVPALLGSIKCLFNNSETVGKWTGWVMGQDRGRKLYGKQKHQHRPEQDIFGPGQSITYETVVVTA